MEPFNRLLHTVTFLDFLIEKTVINLTEEYRNRLSLVAIGQFGAVLFVMIGMIQFFE